jgi:hypothetical protein
MMSGQFSATNRTMANSTSNRIRVRTFMGAPS